MNDQLGKQILRQLKILNVWIGLIGAFVVAAIIALGLLLLQLVQVIEKTNTQLSAAKTELSKSVNVQEQLCRDRTKLADLLRTSGICS